MALSSGEGLTSLQHFIGVVEDRNDPLNIGRVRVRCFGVHTDNKSDIPTDALPWAMPVMPYHSASISGIGQSPTGPVEGSWVFGLFIDGQEMQQPIVLGTMVGIPKEKIASTKGFSDPLGIYPKEKYMRQSDVNKLARGETAYGEETLAVKVRDRTTAVPTAVPPTVASVRDLEGPVKPANTYINKGQSGDFYYRNRWNEPNPRYGGSTSPDGAHETCFTDDSEKTQPWQQRKPGTSPNRSLYPFNHTYTTESGHVMEYDDTPGGERIHQYHTKGTFYEIQPDGTKVTKVVGDDYQIYLKGNHVVVEGNMNLTVKGDVRLLSQGNMYHEVKGDYHLRVDGDMVTKIQGNEQKVILTDKATQINGNERKRISVNYQKTIEGNHEEKIKGMSNTINSSNVFIMTDGWHRELIGGSLTMQTGANTNLIVGSPSPPLEITKGGGTRVDANTGRLNIKTTSNVNITTAASFNLDTSAEMDLNIGTNYDLTTGGTYKKKITGAAHETYQSTYFVKYVGQNEFDHAGVWKEMKGSDKYNRHSTGVDYTCPTDPSRTSDTNCDDLATPASPSH